MLCKWHANTRTSQTKNARAANKARISSAKRTSMQMATLSALYCTLVDITHIITHIHIHIFLYNRQTGHPPTPMFLPCCPHVAPILSALSKLSKLTPCHSNLTPVLLLCYPRVNTAYSKCCPMLRLCYSVPACHPHVTPVLPPRYPRVAPMWLPCFLSRVGPMLSLCFPILLV